MTRPTAIQTFPPELPQARRRTTVNPNKSVPGPPELLSRYVRELADPSLVERILEALPMVPDEPERVLRCSRENAERALCRALALAAERGELWRVEITGGAL